MIFYHMTGCKQSFLLVIERVTLLMSPSNHEGGRHYKKCLPPSGGEGDITKNVSLQVRERETLQINVSLTKKCVTQRNYKKYF